MLYDLRGLFRKGKMVDSRLFDTIEDLYEKVEAGTGADTSELEAKITALEARVEALENAG